MVPIQNASQIPNEFQRSEAGTSIFIIGLKPDDKRIEEMTRELLANFWLAIYVLPARMKKVLRDKNGNLQEDVLVEVSLYGKDCLSKKGYEICKKNHGIKGKYRKRYLVYFIFRRYINSTKYLLFFSLFVMFILIILFY
jgi:hypothetical protein